MELTKTYIDIIFGLAGMMVQLREQVKSCLMKKREGPEADVTVAQQRIQIEHNQTNTLKLCTEKVLLVKQAYELVPLLGTLPCVTSLF